MPLDAARAKSLFLIASDISDPAARNAFLERECSGDVELRARVEALLRANDAAPLPPVAVEEGIGTIDSQSPATGEPVHSSVALGTVISGKYKLVEVIGEGGMGCVYLAKQTEPVQRTVAAPGLAGRWVLGPPGRPIIGHACSCRVRSGWSPCGQCRWCLRPRTGHPVALVALVR